MWHKCSSITSLKSSTSSQPWRRPQKNQVAFNGKHHLSQLPMSSYVAKTAINPSGEHTEGQRSFQELRQHQQTKEVCDTANRWIDHLSPTDATQVCLERDKTEEKSSLTFPDLRPHQDVELMKFTFYTLNRLSRTFPCHSPDCCHIKTQIIQNSS